MIQDTTNQFSTVNRYCGTGWYDIFGVVSNVWCTGPCAIHVAGAFASVEYVVVQVWHSAAQKLCKRGSVRCEVCVTILFILPHIIPTLLDHGCSWFYQA